MKQNEVEQGGVYIAKVNGRLVKVRIDRIESHSDWRGRSCTRYHVTNLLTNRKTVFRAASKFRGPAGPDRIDPVSARLTTTPLCFFDGHLWHYFDSEQTIEAEFRRRGKSFAVWAIDRTTGFWHRQPKPEETEACETCGGDTPLDNLDEDGDCHDCQRNKATVV